MKNTFQINIGTRTNDGGKITIPEIATALRRHGLVLTACRIVTGIWEGVPEETLACECLPALPVCHAECRLAIATAIGKLARELRQTCIAVRWPEGHGELCPPVSGLDFSNEYFQGVWIPAIIPALEGEAANVPACDCLSNVSDACNHLAQVAEDNGDIAATTKYLRAEHTLQSNADNLRAVICPTPAPAPARTPDRAFFESIAFDLKAIREHAENIESSQACIRQEIDSLRARIYPLAVKPPRTQEITSGW